jgi:hypothetical protein
MISKGSVNGQTMIWSTSLLRWIAWDGSLTASAVNIGAVTGPLTNTELRADDVYTYVNNHAVLGNGAGGSCRYVSGTASSAGNNLVLAWPGEIGKHLRLHYVSYQPSAAVEVGFRFGTAGQIFLLNSITTGGSVVAKDFGDFRFIDAVRQSDSTDDLYLWLSAAVPTIYNIFYTKADDYVTID